MFLENVYSYGEIMKVEYYIYVFIMSELVSKYFSWKFENRNLGMVMSSFRF